MLVSQSAGVGTKVSRYVGWSVSLDRQICWSLKS